VFSLDDLLIVSSDHELERIVKKQLQDKYRMADLGRTRRFLGLEIEWDDENSTVTLGQQDYIDTIVKRFDMKDANHTSSPLGLNASYITRGVKIFITYCISL
jgi:hypothetical protein